MERRNYKMSNCEHTYVARSEKGKHNHAYYAKNSTKRCERRLDFKLEEKENDYE